jgi:hypothetical protein
VTADKWRITRGRCGRGIGSRTREILLPALMIVVPAGIEPATFRV